MARKNIVFDLGGVLLRWNVDEIAGEIFEAPTTKARVVREVFGHPDWLKMDAGILEEREAIGRFARRTGCEEESIQALMLEVKKHLVPLPHTREMIRHYDERGFDLYCLSNMHKLSFSYIHEHLDIWEPFKGIVISAEIRMIKPEPEIFLYLLDKFALKAQETVFIDDHIENVRGAEAVGMKGIVFRDAESCQEEVEALCTE